jgi:hypothetical protein
LKVSTIALGHHKKVTKKRSASAPTKNQSCLFVFNQVLRFQAALGGLWGVKPRNNVHCLLILVALLLS